jgi:hypothetical protein
MDSGEISQIDIEFGNLLIDAGKLNKFLANITLNRVIQTDKAYYLLTGKGDVEKIKRAMPSMKSKIRAITNLPIYYLEKSKNKKKVLEDLFDPIVPLSHSVIMIPPEGDKELKIKFKRVDKDELKIDAEELSIITQDLFGMRAHYSFN